MLAWAFWLSSFMSRSTRPLGVICSNATGSPKSLEELWGSLEPRIPAGAYSSPPQPESRASARTETSSFFFTGDPTLFLGIL